VSLTLSICPIHDKDNDSYKNEGKERHLGSEDKAPRNVWEWRCNPCNSDVLSNIGIQKMNSYGVMHVMHANQIELRVHNPSVIKGLSMTARKNRE